MKNSTESDHNMSVRECYSDMSDEELDQKVRVIKARMQALEWLKEVSKQWAIGYNGEE